MLFAELAAASAAVGATRSRLAKAEALVARLRAMAPDEVVPGVAYLSGELRQRQIGVGWASLAELPPPAAGPSLTVLGVDGALDEIGRTRGAGSAARRRELIGALFAAATAGEQRFLRGLLTGEVRQGALAGVMADAVAKAAEVPAEAVRRAVLLSGDLREVAAAALAGGTAALAAFRLRVGTPLSPMLAGTAPDLADAMERMPEVPGEAGGGRLAAVDDKLDGIRIQAHRDGADVAVFTRSLDDITARVPEIVAAVRALPGGPLVLDGEALVVGPDGRPVPFQATSSRAGTRTAGAARPELLPYLFDVLHAGGADLMDAPATDRWSVLDELVPAGMRVGRRMARTVEEGDEGFAAALAAGHEGVVVKSPSAPYEAGRRGGGWLKVKPRHTLDLVVLAAEWGHGRRQGWLSNLHLGAADGTGFAMLGKTFKGLTDELLSWQTERLLELSTRREGHIVWVRPELVVEIAFDGVQASTRYPAGMALRFARVLRYREDKTAADADTVETVRAIHRGRAPG